MSTNNKKTKGVADDIDKHVGKQLKKRRTLLGLSQEKLAERIGVTFQQVQKYERGTNRISASRLLSFSKFLGVSVNYFYAGMEEASASEKKLLTGMSDNNQALFTGPSPENFPEDIFSSKETTDLLRTYYSIEDEKERKEILKVLKTMVKKIA